jgi:SET domain-containing protein
LLKTTSEYTPKRTEMRDVPGKGRGMFATKKIKKGTIIEICPVIPIKKREWKDMDETILSHYAFEWGSTGKDACLVLGHGSIYNHSYDPNADNFNDMENVCMEFVATRDIAKGEEITINYNDDDCWHEPLWFHVEE